MKITIIQPDLLWENRHGNLSHLDLLIEPLLNNTDIVVLPEMFTTGFSMNVTLLAESQEGETFIWLKKTAMKGNFGICGSYIVQENNLFYNRWLFVSPEGDHYYYDKRHLFSMGGEDRFYTPGKSRLIFNFRGFRISPYICYDLRFPVWSRNLNEYDLAIYSASWPESRIGAWNTLLPARAIENQCYVAASNRIGTDGNGVRHNGLSQVINPRGEIICSAGIEECTFTSDIPIQELIAFRNKFNVLRDSDEFTIFF